MSSRPPEDLDEVVHERTRLGILAVLGEGGRVQLGFLGGALGLGDDDLSRHLAVLEDAGYVDVDESHEGRHPRTWVKITRAGRGALAAEVAALEALVGRLGSGRPPGSH